MYGIICKQVRVPAAKHTTTIIHASDTHIDGASHDDKLFSEIINRVKKEKDTYLCLPGDLGDPDRPSIRSRRKIAFADRPSVLSHEDIKDLAYIDKYLLPKFAPIADKVIAMLDGDHFIQFNTGMTSTQYICERLKIPYIGERVGAVRLQFIGTIGNNRCAYNICMRHGVGGTGSAGNSVNALIKQNANFEGFDFYVGGHNHKLDIHAEQIVTPNFERKKWQGRTVLYCRAGSCLSSVKSGVNTYAEKAEYAPLPTGYIEHQIITGRKHDEAFRVLSHSAKMELPMSVDY